MVINIAEQLPKLLPRKKMGKLEIETKGRMKTENMTTGT